MITMIKPIKTKWTQKDGGWEFGFDVAATGIDISIYDCERMTAYHAFWDYLEALIIDYETMSEAELSSGIIEERNNLRKYFVYKPPAKPKPKTVLVMDENIDGLIEELREACETLESCASIQAHVKRMLELIEKVEDKVDDLKEW